MQPGLADPAGGHARLARRQGYVPEARAAADRRA